MPAESIRIGSRAAGAGEPCFVIAEVGVNHNGDVGRARELIDAAAEAGADAVKFQTFRADRLVTRSAPKAAYQAAATGVAESQHAMLQRLELSLDDHRELIAHCERRGIRFLSTPHDEESIDVLRSLGVAAIKVGSGDVTNAPYLRLLARHGLPVILSTGMSTLGEVEAAVEIVRGGGAPLALLHCVSNYPAAPEDCNLRAMDTLRAAFGGVIGYSDHSLGIELSVAAVARGAAVLEKHLTLDRTLPGPDHRASLEPPELMELMRSVRSVERALGDGIKRPVAGELDTRAVARKSVVAEVDIPAGTTVREEMLTVKRPGTGVSPGELERLVGMVARRAVCAGEVVTWDDFR